MIELKGHRALVAAHCELNDEVARLAERIAVLEELFVRFGAPVATQQIVRDQLRGADPSPAAPAGDADASYWVRELTADGWRKQFVHSPGYPEGPE